MFEEQWWVFLELRVHVVQFWANDSILIMMFAWGSKLLRHRFSNSASETLVLSLIQPHCDF